ncbi:MAG TPA: hypothetical protein VI953_03450 [Candidatus Paceibacterota bacterium]
MTKREIFATIILGIALVCAMVVIGPNKVALEAPQRLEAQNPIISSTIEPGWQVVLARHHAGSLDVLTTRPEEGGRFGSPVFISSTDWVDTGDKIMVEWITYDAMITGVYDESLHRRIPTVLYVYGSAIEDALVEANERTRGRT